MSRSTLRGVTLVLSLLEPGCGDFTVTLVLHSMLRGVTLVLSLLEPGCGDFIVTLVLHFQAQCYRSHN